MSGDMRIERVSGESLPVQPQTSAPQQQEEQWFPSQKKKLDTGVSVEKSEEEKPTITFGGVCFNEDEIDSKLVYTWNGRYYVRLKNGVQLTYPEQPKAAPEGGTLRWYSEDGREISIGEAADIEFRGGSVRSNTKKITPSVNCTSIKQGVARTDLTDIHNASITALYGMDDSIIVLDGNSEFNRVNLDSNNNPDEVYFSDSTSHNEVILGKEDSAYINGKHIKGSGSAEQDSY